MVDSASSSDFVERVARTLAKIDQSRFEDDPNRFRFLARAAMAEFRRPTPEMISAAYEAVRFDEGWAINTGRDFEKGVNAMIDAALDEGMSRRLLKFVQQALLVEQATQPWSAVQGRS